MLPTAGQFRKLGEEFLKKNEKLIYLSHKIKLYTELRTGSIVDPAGQKHTFEIPPCEDDALCQYPNQFSAYDVYCPPGGSYYGYFRNPQMLDGDNERTIVLEFWGLAKAAGKLLRKIPDHLISDAGAFCNLKRGFLDFLLWCVFLHELEGNRLKENRPSVVEPVYLKSSLACEWLADRLETAAIVADEVDLVSPLKAKTERNERILRTVSKHKSLCQEDELFLSDTAQKVAMLVAKSSKTMNYFRKQLTEFADKWTAYETAKEAERKGKWQPSMGRPSNPLWSIWPRNAGASCFPDFGDIPHVLGGYALLAVIHDNVLPNCSLIAKGILPKELVNKIWRDLITGANEESRAIIPDATYYPERVIPDHKIKNFFREVEADIDSYLTPKESMAQKPADRNKAAQKHSTDIKSRFKIEESRISFDDADLDLPTGKTVDIAKMLIENFGSVVKYNLLDKESSAKEASDNLRKQKSIIQKKLKNTPCHIKTKKQAGYTLTAK